MTKFQKLKNFVQWVLDQYELSTKETQNKALEAIGAKPEPNTKPDFGPDFKTVTECMDRYYNNTRVQYLEKRCQILETENTNMQQKIEELQKQCNILDKVTIEYKKRLTKISTTSILNALKTYIHFHNKHVYLTLKQLKDIKFLLTINNIGKKKAEEIVNNAEYYYEELEAARLRHD